jgi:hypothetical protein
MDVQSADGAQKVPLYSINGERASLPENLFQDG